MKLVVLFRMHTFIPVQSCSRLYTRVSVVLKRLSCVEWLDPYGTLKHDEVYYFFISHRLTDSVQSHHVCPSCCITLPVLLYYNGHCSSEFLRRLFPPLTRARYTDNLPSLTSFLSNSLMPESASTLNLSFPQLINSGTLSLFLSLHLTMTSNPSNTTRPDTEHPGL